MTTTVPLPKLPDDRPTSAQPEPEKWPVAVIFSDKDSEEAVKLRKLAAAYGKKPGPFMLQVMSEFLQTVDVDEILAQKELPLTAVA
ncbi:MAG: hypothetical protein L0G87_04720 [Renibacterium salmoninarum]|jgi:hypothetical protein|uniref:hypothetical protein n=1 Tax=Arthrobacter russicus TaxID=172040 RepID=UPI00265210FD|nr:hypothetical protein [Renibacterium salmoninarum]